MATVWQLLFLIAVFTIVYVYALHFVRQFMQEDATERQIAAMAPLMEFAFQRPRAVDCSLNRLPCVTDQQCRDNCVIASAASNLACDNGFCSATNALAEAQIPDSTNECDPALGLLRVHAAGGDFVVAQTCVSTYRDLVDDAGVARPYLCDAGSLRLKLDAEPFSAEACTCGSGFDKLLFRQTALARSVPVCIPWHMANLYQRVYI
ncbi:PIF-3 [Choristoneura occidentalis alphabaculovirus]|nr:PIF-3 [Choristoneura occidentalis alphabaculovirus]